ncbi:unnamed protein product, partial [Meganyctiphanes norvegica]
MVFMYLQNTIDTNFHDLQHFFISTLSGKYDGGIESFLKIIFVKSRKDCRKFKQNHLQQVRNMSVFIQQHNPMTGTIEWGIQPDDYDYKQEVARSAYADMLHDKERNDKYFEGLRRSVADLRMKGKEVHVLDIGTGTGLLSMMAVACGVDSVTACEAFHPVAECAKKVLTANGCAEKVHLIPKRSTEIEVGPGKDMERRANLLITEVFDTELIGEGGIETYKHAQENLLTPDALYVPSEATIYAQVVSSEKLQYWNRLSPVHRKVQGANNDDPLISIPQSVQECAGAAAVHDIQLSQVPQDWITKLSHPLKVFWFDWSGRKKKIDYEETSRVKFSSLAPGSCDAVLMWWDLKMDQKGDVMLSCAPYWAHPDLEGKEDGTSEHIPWRDHWMQAIYYLPPQMVSQVQEGKELTLFSAHDEYSLWFNVQENQDSAISEERPICTCGIHIVNSRSRLGQMNDPRRLNTYLRILEKHINSDSVCFVLGDGCLMAVAAAKLGARQVYVSESNDSTRRIMQEFVISNAVQDKVTVTHMNYADIPLEQVIAPGNITFSEPFFSTSLLPWHSLYCWYLRNSMLHLLAENALSMPKKMTVWGVPVQYRDLWKIRAPLHECNGFKMDIFDSLIETASDEADEKVEPHPLWEYPARALAKPQPLMTLDLGGAPPEKAITVSGSFSLTGTGTLNGMALWADWDMTSCPEDIISTGPVKPVVVNEYISWDVYTQQGVYLMKENPLIKPDLSQILQYYVSFCPNDGTVSFDFKFNKNI